MKSLNVDVVCVSCHIDGIRFKFGSRCLVYSWRRLVASIMMIYAKYTNQNFIQCVCARERAMLHHHHDTLIFSDRFLFCLLFEWMATRMKHICGSTSFLSLSGSPSLSLSRSLFIM